MIYRLHTCEKPFDPHRTTYASLDAFHDACPAVREFANPIAAYSEICARWPDAVFMPASVRLGSGTTVMLGILRNLSDHGGASSGEIPFVAWVRAEPEGVADQKRIRNSKGNPFDRKFWRTPVKHPPSGSRFVKAELRASDLETPSPGEATIWQDGDRFVLHMEVGGGEISIALANVTGYPTPVPEIAPAFPDVLSSSYEINREFRIGPRFVDEVETKHGRDAASDVVQARDWYANGLTYEDRPGVVASYHPLIHKVDWAHIVEVARRTAKGLGRWIWLTLGEDRWVRISLGASPDTDWPYPSDQYIMAFSPSGDEHFVGCS